MDQLDHTRQDGKVTDYDMENGLNEELKTIGLFAGLKSDCIVRARKEFKGSAEDFNQWLMLGCLGIRARTHKLVFKDFAAQFVPVT